MMILLTIRDEPVVEPDHSYGTIRFDVDLLEGLLDRRRSSCQELRKVFVASRTELFGFGILCPRSGQRPWIENPEPGSARQKHSSDGSAILHEHSVFERF